MLSWLLDHIWVVVAIAGVVAKLLQAVRGKSEGEGQPRAGEPPAKEYEFDDPELAERTRKIREDIQRRIAERRGQQLPSQPEPVATAEPPPLVREIVIETPRRAVVMPEAVSVSDTRRQAELLEEQAGLMEKLREAELMRAAAARRTEFEEATADHTASARQETRTTVLTDLKSPDALRRAFILREVLGPPVALR